jgi:Protein of unknown function (DUF4238)
MVARLHHFLPQCYLKGFARNRSKKSALFAMDAKVGRTFETTPRRVAVERDFNRIDVIGTAPDEVETQMAQFEGKLDKALEKIIERRSFLDESDRIMVLNFIALAAIRNPRMRENMRSAQEQTAKIILDLSLASRERWEDQMQQMREAGHPTAGTSVTYEEVKDFHERGEYSVSIDRTRHILREFSTAEAVLPLLFQRKWCLLKAPPGSGAIITSDHPVCLIWTNAGEQRNSVGPGLGSRNADLLFPLSKDLGLLGRFEGNESEYDISPYQAAAFNGTVASFAGRQVFACNDRFVYVMRPGAAPKRAAKLFDEPGFGRRSPAATARQ